MLLDLISLRVFAAELDDALRGRRIEVVTATVEELSWMVAGAAENALSVRFGPPGGLYLGQPARPVVGDGPERYLLGAVVESVSAAPRDRILGFRLSRRDADGEQTYGVMHIELIPPRYRVALVGERHGRVLGSWAGKGDRRATRRGHDYAPGDQPDRLTPGEDREEDLHRSLLGCDAGLVDALRRIVLGADRHVAARICSDAGLAPEQPAAGCTAAQAADLWSAVGALHGGVHPRAFRWHAGSGRWRVSVLEPVRAHGDVERFDSVSAALCSAPGSPATDSPVSRQRHRLTRALAVLGRRADALQADLDEATEAESLERTGNSLLAAADTIPPGPGRVRVRDVYDQGDEATLAVELAPGQTATEKAARLLKRARRYRRRLEALPARLHRVREHVFGTQRLVERLDGDRAAPIPEDEMERWQKRVDVHAPAEEGKGRRGAGDRRGDAHPRRYLTRTGWSVWAGRNNRENDVLTHKLAAQNDVWFHAHGYAGSHVILRREGRREEPDGRTLEEAAAVAAYWSKGRTARKVPVVYTLAKFVSKPRGGAPGLAVLKREKTIVVRPQLPETEEDGA